MSTHKVIGQNGKEIRSKVLLHPGEVLEEELEARGIKRSVFAMDLKIYPSHFSKLLWHLYPFSPLICSKNATDIFLNP